MTLFTQIYDDTHNFANGNIEIANTLSNLGKAYLETLVTGLPDSLAHPILLGFLYQIDANSRRSRPYPIVSQRQTINLDLSECETFLFIPSSRLIDDYILRLYVSTESGDSEPIDLSAYALKSELPVLDNYVSESALVAALSDYVLSASLPNFSNYALVSQLPDLSLYALLSDTAAIDDRLDILENSIPTTVYPQKIKINGGGDRGLFWYLGTLGTDEDFVDPITRNSVFGLMSSLLVDYTDAKNSVNRIPVSPSHSLNFPNSWIGFDLGVNRSILLDRYLLRSRLDFDGNHLRTWVLEGTNSINENTIAGFDAATWETIDSRAGFNGLTGVGLSASFNASKDSYYRYIRLRQSGTDSAGTYYLTLNGIELFGVLKLTAQYP